jgi:hypothetical protein
MVLESGIICTVSGNVKSESTGGELKFKYILQTKNVWLLGVDGKEIYKKTVMELFLQCKKIFNQEYFPALKSL